ncbi:hypothetical protein PIB30_065592 [Stylosanthes scabra]|uniref:Cyclin-dependent kinase inhibitor domain-containing protein n=1 Tax=Stylosanthes scabra TaxID=79078 RepID=A0ABU6ZKU8_9FABA|nr:hypothetical protein [Stylosanthes scabra]
MDKKGKKAIHFPRSKIYVKTAATMNLGEPKPPPASPPAMPKPPKKEPVVIDLTKDSDFGGNRAQKNHERIENTFRRMLGFEQATNDNDDDDFLRDESIQWEYGDLDVWKAMALDESSEGSCSRKPPSSR